MRALAQISSIAESVKARFGESGVKESGDGHVTSENVLDLTQSLGRGKQRFQSRVEIRNLSEEMSYCVGRWTWCRKSKCKTVWASYNLTRSNNDVNIARKPHWENVENIADADVPYGSPGDGISNSIDYFTSYMLSN